MKVEIKIDESVIRFDIKNKNVKLSDIIKDFEKVIDKYNNPKISKEDLAELDDKFFNELFNKK